MGLAPAVAILAVTQIYTEQAIFLFPSLDKQQGKKKLIGNNNNNDKIFPLKCFTWHLSAQPRHHSSCQGGAWSQRGLGAGEEGGPGVAWTRIGQGQGSSKAAHLMAMPPLGRGRAEGRPGGRPAVEAERPRSSLRAVAAGAA